ncbi:unnamed protein product [Victoria cruziana]
MIQLLYTLLVGEGLVVLLLILKNPMRKLVTMCLDRVKRGRGPVVVKTLVGVLFVLMVASLHSIFKIHKRSDEFGSITPTDQVLVSRLMLEASLMGFCIFLTLMIDRMHHYIRELRMMRKTIEPLKMQSRSSEEWKNGGSTVSELEKELSSLKEKVKHLEAVAEAKDRDAKAAEANTLALKDRVKHLEAVAETKDKDAKAAEASALALKKQSEGFLLEYDRLLEDNQNLRSQLESFERKSSLSDNKKNS